jgi:hypothetical protein
MYKNHRINTRIKTVKTNHLLQSERRKKAIQYFYLIRHTHDKHEITQIRPSSQQYDVMIIFVQQITYTILMCTLSPRNMVWGTGMLSGNFGNNEKKKY